MKRKMSFLALMLVVSIALVSVIVPATSIFAAGTEKTINLVPKDQAELDTDFALGDQGGNKVTPSFSDGKFVAEAPAGTWPTFARALNVELDPDKPVYVDLSFLINSGSIKVEFSMEAKAGQEGAIEGHMLYRLDVEGHMNTNSEIVTNNTQITSNIDIAGKLKEAGLVNEEGNIFIKAVTIYVVSGKTTFTKLDLKGTVLNAEQEPAKPNLDVDYSFLPKNADDFTKNGNVNVAIENGVVKVSTNGEGWPMASTNVGMKFDATKPLTLVYDITVNKGVSQINLMLEGQDDANKDTKEFKPGDDMGPGTYQKEIDLIAALAGKDFIKDGVVSIDKIGIFINGAEASADVRVFGVRGTLIGGGDNNQGGNNNKPGNNQTSDVSVLVSMLMAAAAVGGGLKLRKSK